MRTINVLILVMLYSFLLTSCNAATVSAPDALANTAEFPDETQAVILSTPVPLATPTRSATLEPVTQEPPNWVDEKKCIVIRDQLPDDDALSGVLVLNGWGKTYIFDLEKKVAHPFPVSVGANVGQYSDDFKVSPDNTWLAYIENYVDAVGRTQIRRLRLMDANLRRLMLSEWSVEWQWIIGWVNEQNIALRIPHREDGEIVVFNPFTSKHQYLSLAYALPEGGSYYSSWYSWGQPLLYYAPNMENVVFPNNEGKVILWDVQNQKELSVGNIAEYATSSNAVWSRDGKYVIIVSSLNDTEKLIWIDLESMETSVIPLGQYVNIEKFSLSPSGEAIAVWVSDDPYGFQQQTLFLINLSNRNILNTCLGDSVFAHEPVWSFDSMNLAIAVDDNNESKVVVIDLENYAANLLVVDKVAPVGWLRSDKDSSP